MNPVMGKVYTYAEIMKLNLTDTPHLKFINMTTVAKEWVVIQQAHVTNEQLLSIPGFAETQWRYMRTTDEEIPIFVHVGGTPIEDCVDIENGKEGNQAWVTPNGYPRDNPDNWEPCEYCGYYFCNCQK